MLEVKISKQAEQDLRDLASQSGRDAMEMASEFLEKEIAENKSANGKDQKNDAQPVSGERRFMRMKGMFASGKTDSARRAKEILREEIGRNGFGDVEKQ